MRLKTEDRRLKTESLVEMGLERGEKMPRDFRKIKAWQLTDDLVIAVYNVTRSLPRSELYGLTSQMQRAAVSVPANIAEGAGAASKKGYLRYLSIAKSSLNETGYYIHLCSRLGYLAKKEKEDLMLKQQESASVLEGLIKAVRREIDV